MLLIQILLMIVFFVPFSFFLNYLLITDLYFLIPAIITKVFNPIAELIIPIRTKETKAEMVMHPVTVELGVSKCSI